jgi:hypothetical protein
MAQKRPTSVHMNRHSGNSNSPPERNGQFELPKCCKAQEANRAPKPMF